MSEIMEKPVYAKIRTTGDFDFSFLRENEEEITKAFEKRIQEDDKRISEGIAKSKGLRLD